MRETNWSDLRPLLEAEGDVPLNVIVWIMCGPYGPPISDNTFVGQYTKEEAEAFARQETKQRQEDIENCRKELAMWKEMSVEELQAHWEKNDKEDDLAYYEEQLGRAGEIRHMLEQRRKVEAKVQTLPQGKIKRVILNALEGHKERNSDERLAPHANPQPPSFNPEEYRGEKIAGLDRAMRYYMSNASVRFNLPAFIKEFDALNAIVPFPTPDEWATLPQSLRPE